MVFIGAIIFAIVMLPLFNVKLPLTVVFPPVLVFKIIFEAPPPVLFNIKFPDTTVKSPFKLTSTG